MHPILDSLTIRHLARVVESSDDAIVSKDLNGVITSWNRSAERMFGYTAEEAIGKSIRMIIPADRQSEEDMVLGCIRSGRSVTHFETLRQRKDGRFIPISLTVSPIFDDGGRVIGASKIARDITDRTQAAAAMRRLAAVVESSDDAIVTKDLDGIITSWNAAAERIFGYTADEAIGRSIRILIPEELQDEEDMVLAKIRAGDRIQHYETVRQRKDGERLSISLTVSPIRNERGEIVGASKVARDITERTQLLLAAREQALNTEKLSEVGAVVASTLNGAAIAQKVTDIARDLTRADFGVFVYTSHDTQPGEASMVRTVSGAAPDAFERAPAELTRELVAGTFRDGAPVRIADVRRMANGDDERQFYGVSADAADVRSYLAVPVRDFGGRLLGGLFFGHSRPDAFTSQHQRLAVGVASWASVALENARLYEQAQSANRLKDEFLAVLSHELRTPLNAIVGYSRLLRGGMLPPDKAARGLETLERNATLLTQIVEDVLDVSRIISGKLRLEVQPVDLPLVIDNAVATIQPAADAKRIQLQTLADPGVGPVAGDPGRLQQVVWNLVSNAVKFTPKNGRVQVRLERVNSHVEITVSDTGAGISADFLPYVFDRFRQAESGTTRKAGGLGLGLAIVRHIVELHGGSVEASSAGVDRGATFRVRLPLMIVHPQPLAAAREHPRTERRQPLTKLDDLSGIRVLAVDDEEDALTLLRTVLEAAGAEVTTVGSPLAALERLTSARPDVVVVDLGMPGMDGFEVIRHIRRSPDADVRNVPAAALTAFARSEDRTKALRSGFEMHLAKPVDPGELVASIATLARRRKTT